MRILQKREKSYPIPIKISRLVQYKQLNIYARANRLGAHAMHLHQQAVLIEKEWQKDFSIIRGCPNFCVNGVRGHWRVSEFLCKRS